MQPTDTIPDEPGRPASGAKPPASRRSRVSTLGALGAVIVVVALAGAIFSLRGPTSDVGRDPTPPATATLTLRQQQILFVHPAPWGKLTLDGQAMSSIVATLTHGTHLLTYDAPPFPTLTCYISAPTGANDTCPAGTIPPTSAFQGRVIDLGATLNRLAPADLAVLIAATQKVLDGSTSTAAVVAGDHYTDATGRVAVATQAISATLSFVVPKHYVIYNGLRCAPFCVGPGPQPLNGEGLKFVIFPTPQWNFSAADGQRWTVGTNPINDNAIDMLALWDGSWQVTVSIVPMVGSTLEETALAHFPPVAGGSGAGGGGTGAGVNAKPLAAGSALPVVGDGDEHGLVLYHFGLSVATDAGARQIYPTMTVASAHEAAFAAQLIAHH